MLPLKLLPLNKDGFLFIIKFTEKYDIYIDTGVVGAVEEITKYPNHYLLMHSRQINQRTMGMIRATKNELILPGEGERLTGMLLKSTKGLPICKAPDDVTQLDLTILLLKHKHVQVTKEQLVAFNDISKDIPTLSKRLVVETKEEVEVIPNA